MIHHAVLDAIYAAKFFRVRSLPIVAKAFACAYLFKKYKGILLATRAILREMLRDNSQGLEAFLKINGLCRRGEQYPKPY